jgi:ABC-type transport system involved in cytochrome bd biosynthesis fused ATPase/permease subunit
MIAHRLTTLEKCDVRLHIEQGRAVTLGREIPTSIRSELTLETC